MTSALNIFLEDVEGSVALGEIPREISKRGYERSRILRSSVKVVERNALLPYPDVRVDPRLTIILHEAFVQAVLHAYLDVKRTKKGVKPLVTVSLPFLCLARKQQMTAVLAHEFLHYINMAMKFLGSDVFSLQQRFGGTITGHLLFDEAAQTPAEKVYKGRYLRELISKRFHSVINDESLTSRIEDEWVDIGLPTTTLGSEDLVVHLSMEEFVNMTFPSEVLRRASQIMVDDQRGPQRSPR